MPLPTLKNNPVLPNDDPWYMLPKLIDDKFNKNREKLVAAFFIKLLDESVLAWHPRKSTTGGYLI
jgi:hypothetical protein